VGCIAAVSVHLFAEVGANLNKKSTAGKEIIPCRFAFAFCEFKREMCNFNNYIHENFTYLIIEQERKIR